MENFNLEKYLDVLNRQYELSRYDTGSFMHALMIIGQVDSMLTVEEKEEMAEKILIFSRVHISSIKNKYLEDELQYLVEYVHKYLIKIFEKEDKEAYDRLIFKIVI